MCRRNCWVITGGGERGPPTPQQLQLSKAIPSPSQNQGTLGHRYPCRTLTLCPSAAPTPWGSVHTGRTLRAAANPLPQPSAGVTTLRDPPVPDPAILAPACSSRPCGFSPSIPAPRCLARASAAADHMDQDATTRVLSRDPPSPTGHSVFILLLKHCKQKHSLFSCQVVNGFHMLHGPGHGICCPVPTKC